MTIARPCLRFLLPLAAAAFPAFGGALIFVQAPPLETLSDSTVSWNLIPVPGQSAALNSCGAYASRLPLGSRFEGRVRLPEAKISVASQPPSLQITFTPSAGNGGPQLALGVHFLVAACADGASMSPEIPLRVATSQPAAVLTPRSQETSSRPEIAWTPVPGVPAYHLLISDQALRIDPDSGKISGASIIWQAIVAGDRILYGAPDPSGNFDKVAPPPLVAGVEYNLGILNNYDGKSALQTSAKAQALRLFTLKPPATPLPPPVVLEPARGAAFRAPNDSAILFRWRSSRASGVAANTYKLYVYAPETQEGVEVLRPVWETEGTDTVTILIPRGVLLKGRYVRKVFALASDGAVSVSDTASFTYESETQLLRLGARTAGTGGDTSRLSGARITVSALDGSGESLPLYSLSGGLLERAFSLGRYRAAFAAEGFETAVLEANLSGDTALSLDPVLAASPSRVSGKVVDSLGRPLSNVVITATGNDASHPAQTQSDAGGLFLLGVPTGSLRLALSKDDYVDKDTAFSAQSGRQHNLGSVVLRKAAALLSGTVATPSGAPVISATVEVRDSAGNSLRKTLADAKGRFGFFLSRGEYRVSASRTGFTGAERMAQLREALDLSLTLFPGASVVKGRVLQITRTASGSELQAPLEGAALTLRPLSSGTATSGHTDVNGAFALSVQDTGEFWLKAEHAEAYADSQRVRIAQPKSTVASEVKLLRFAALSGRIRVQPDTALDPGTVRISLLPIGGGTAVASAAASTLPFPDSLGRLAFSLERVPEGSYRLACGLPGYTPASEPTVPVTRGLRIDTLALTLRRMTSQATFRFRRGGSDLQGTVRLRSPFSDTLAAGSKRFLEGTWVLDAEPRDRAVLALRGFTARVAGTPGLDTTLDLPFVVAHDTSATSLRPGFVDLAYRLDEKADQGFIVYSSLPGKWDSLALNGVDLDSGQGLASIPLRPQGGTLEYAFSFRFGSRVYGGMGSPFRVETPRDGGLGELVAAEGDTLVLPVGGRCRVTIRARSAAGDPLDAGVALNGKIRFRLSAGFPGSVESIQGLTALLRVNQTLSPALKIADGKSPAAWDTLEVTVTYAGRTLVEIIPLRVAPFSAHRLRLTSLLGDFPVLSAPMPIALQATAFDTSTSPPTPLVANPEFRLNPPEAGRVEGAVLFLDTAFLGPVRVYARHMRADGKWLQAELFEERDSVWRGIHVGQTLKPGDGTRRFFHNRNVELECPAGAFPSGAQLRLLQRPLSRTFSSLRASSLEGPAYEVSNPSSAPLASPLEIRISPPRSRNPALSTLRRFDASRLRWFELSDTGRGDANRFGLPYLSARIDAFDGQYYGLFSQSNPLGLSEFEIIPNPFSPRVTATRDGNALPGARIRFRPESDSSAAVTVSLRVYTVGGEPVCTLVDHKTFPKIATELYWDGRDGRGRKVRNGRYLLSATLTPTGGGRTKTLVKPVVVYE